LNQKVCTAQIGAVMQQKNYPDFIELFKLHEVQQITKLSKSSIYSAIKNGLFPKPIKIGKRAVAWKLLDIHNWIQDRTKGVQK
jgi:prophage regulatory protein